MSFRGPARDLKRQSARHESIAIHRLLLPREGPLILSPVEGSSGGRPTPCQTVTSFHHRPPSALSFRGPARNLGLAPPSSSPTSDPLPIEDRWVLSRLNRTIEDVTRALKAVEANQPETSSFLDTAHVLTPKGWVVPKTPSQQMYLEAIRQHDLVIGIGPAGTGKTYMAMAMALAALTKKEVQRIVLARPAVEAGERLGFLPGDMFAKVHPYLRPLYDALYAMMDVERANRLIERGDIEMAPLAFMRGRTLNDAFVILDEAQNATSEQMKMFLTRLGFNSKAVVTGDITQVDLPPDRPSGLIQVSEILRNVDGIKFVYFQDRDVVRHRLVQDIIKAYNQHGNGTGKGAASASADE